MDDLQLLDPDIGPIIGLRLQQSDKPSIKQLLPLSEPVKALHSQWELLVLVDGVLYRRWSVKEVSGDVLQLLMPRALR